MVLQEIGGGGYDYAQGSTPSGAEIGETWLDTGVSPPQSKVYNGSSWVSTDDIQRILNNLDAKVSEAGGAPDVLDELQSGRTRELLLLLQDRPIPEVQDPLNFQSGLSNTVEQSGSDYQLNSGGNGSTVSRDPSYTTVNTIFTGLVINPNTALTGVKADISQEQSTVSDALIEDSDGNTLDTVSGSFSSGDTIQFDASLTAGNDYRIYVTSSSGDASLSSDTSFPQTSRDIDIVGGWSNGSSTNAFSFNNVTAIIAAATSGYATDNFGVTTTAPTDFKQWNAIRAEDVTTGGSTSSIPVEFEILDSTDTVLNSSRIPKSKIADAGFKLRNRKYEETASAGQTTFTIPTTGAGGHYGIPILSIVTVEQNGSVLDGAWSFDDDDTVTLDSGANDGDTITVSYDLDVFDSTLQPRAYLSREDTSETSPSISHFRYEYVI